MMYESVFRPSLDFSRIDRHDQHFLGSGKGVATVKKKSIFRIGHNVMIVSYCILTALPTVNCSRRLRPVYITVDINLTVKQLAYSRLRDKQIKIIILITQNPGESKVHTRHTYACACIRGCVGCVGCVNYIVLAYMSVYYLHKSC